MSVGRPSLSKPISRTQIVGKALRRLLDALVIVAGSCTFALTALFLLVTLVNGATAGTRDFVVYWATAQQFAHHANPYDPVALIRIERQAGLVRNVLYMRNPPWTLPLTLPLALLPVRAASGIWTLLLLGALGASMRLLWAMNGRPRDHWHLLGFAFAPALMCILFGQTSIFALLGLILFLRLHAARPFLAGTSLWLCALKPHLLLPFALVLLSWVIITRSYRILAGALAALFASTVIVYRVDPAAWTQYAQMMHASGVARDEFIPCLSLMMRLSLRPTALWLQYVPVAIGSLWMLQYYWSRRSRWSWLEHGNLVVLVSMLVAPYAWPFDQVLVLPALLFALYRSRSRNLLLILVLANALIEVAVFVEGRFPSAMYFWTLWAAPLWLVWYLIARRSPPLTGPGVVIPSFIAWARSAAHGVETTVYAQASSATVVSQRSKDG